MQGRGLLPGLRGSLSGDPAFPRCSQPAVLPLADPATGGILPARHNLCVLGGPIGLVVRKNDIGKWPSPVSIETFVQNNRLGISRSRSYSPSLDAALQQARPEENIFVDSSDKLIGNLLKMLVMQRVDGVLGYPFEAMYNARTAHIADRIAVVPLLESTQYIIGRIAAPKTVWGIQIISRINEILVEKRPDEAYRQAFERWLTPDSIADFNRVYRTEFLQQQ